THPYRPLAAMEGFFELRAICDDPPVNGGVIHLHPAFLHEFFDMARAQWVGQIPADPHQNDLCGEMGPFETNCHRRLPHEIPLVIEGDHTPYGLKGKLRQSRRNTIVKHRNATTSAPSCLRHLLCRFPLVTTAMCVLRVSCRRSRSTL